jgi:thioredoxin-like negative regulator of GroEL
VTTRSIKIDAAWKTAVLIITAIALIPCAWLVMRWCMAGSAVGRAADADLALYLAQLAPDDPQTHHAAAVQLEKSFDPTDVAKALREFEITAALAPDNYQFWLDLGRARERSGDTEAAEAALRRALALAPNYSRVQWALGNALLRQGRIDEAFAEIRKAVAGDSTFAGPATTAAWQFFDGDLARIRSAMGASSQFDASLAALLAREKRFDEAMGVWRELSTEEKKTTLKDVGTTMLGQLVAAKRFREAASVSSEVNGSSERVGQVTNGGFESAVKPEGAGIFEWQIGAGLQPQIVLNNTQKHGGNNSLLLVFNATDAKDFRAVSQLVALEPGRTYELELFYRSDLKTSAVFKWEVLDATGGSSIATTGLITSKAEWSPLSARFTVPANSDAVIIRLVREGCGQVCAVGGSLWFDDVTVGTVAR